MSDGLQRLIDEHERAMREHESIRQRLREVKARRFEAQTKRGQYARTDWRYAQCEKQEADCARAVDELQAKFTEASIVRQRADATLRAAIATRGEVAPVPPPSAAPRQPNPAQLQHLSLLATKVRNDELKMRARLDAANDFIAIALSILKEVTR